MDDADKVLDESNDTNTVNVSEDVNHSSSEDSYSNADSDEKMDVDADELDVETEEMEQRVKSDPSDYKAHCAIIRLYRRMGELDKLREARQRMLIYYPLSPEMWLDWLRDEQKFIEEEEERRKLKDLFELALKDYVDIDVWLEYCTFMIGGLDCFGTESVRSVFEEALSWCGSHFTKANILWESYRDLELVFYAKAQASSNTEIQNEQILRINNLYSRQLKIPLQNMQTTWEEYKEWKGDEQIDSHLEQEFQKALTKCLDLHAFEDKLESLSDESEQEMERVQIYMSYLDYEIKHKDMTRILCLFERAICEHCLVPELWMKYADFMETKLAFGSKLLPFYYRAVRNVSSSTQLWLQYAVATERFEEEFNKVKSVFEKAISSDILTPKEFLLLWLNYLSCIHRFYMNATDDSKASLAEELRSQFDRATDQVYTNFGNQGDPQCLIYQFWALFEAKDMKNMEKARTKWTEIMKLDHGNKADMWIRHIDFELRFGDMKHVEKVFGRAINSVTDDPERVFQRYMAYMEQENDSLSALLEVKKKISAQRQRLAERNAAALAKSAAQQNQKKSAGKQNQKTHKRDAVEASGDMTSSPSKKPKMESFQSTSIQKDIDGFTKPQIPLSKTHQGNTKKTKENVSSSNESISTDDVRKTSSQSHGSVVQHDPNKDHITVFISNLDFNTQEDQIKTILEKCGPIKEIRLVRNYRGASKGFGYVEFEEESSIPKALQMDRTPIPSPGSSAGGRPMFVTACDPQNRHSFEYNTGLERHKLFVKHIARSVTTEQLRELFSKYGTIKDLRIPTLRNGLPKGWAYIEFSNAEEASRALVKMDDYELAGQKLFVQLSNPPARMEKSDFLDVPHLSTFVSHHGQGQATISSTTLGGGSRNTNEHGKARTKVDISSLIPRNVSRASSSKTNYPSVKLVSTPSNATALQIASGNSKEVSSQSRKTNEEFRKMFMKH